jgi:hypothetical protein
MIALQVVRDILFIAFGLSLNVFWIYLMCNVISLPLIVCKRNSTVKGLIENYSKTFCFIRQESIFTLPNTYKLILIHQRIRERSCAKLHDALF